MTRFLGSAHRTVRAVFPHTALGLVSRPGMRGRRDCHPPLRAPPPLGPAVQLPLKRPDRCWSCQAQRPISSPRLRPKHPEPGPLPSTGVTRLPRYYGPLRRPPRPVPYGTVEGQQLPPLGGPPVLRRALSLRATLTTPASHPEALAVVPLPSTTAFPALESGRHSRLRFRGLLRVHSRCGPQIRWPSLRGLLSGWLDDPSCPETAPP